MAKIIAVANQKGGVTKSTTSMALAAGLKLKGYHVLLVDTDPQCNASDTYRAKIEGEATLYDVMKEGCPATEAIQTTPYGDILPCDPLLKEAEQTFTQMGKEFILRERLEPIAGDYDYIIIDTPPTLGVLLANALTAANSVLIPITPDRYSLQGLSQLRETLQTIRKYTNPTLTVSGLLVTKYNGRTVLARDINEDLPSIAEMLGTKVFDSKIRESIAVREAQAARLVLFEYAPSSTTAQDYTAFTDEFVRTEGHNG